MRYDVIQFEGMFVFILPSIVDTLLLKEQREMYYHHISAEQAHWVLRCFAFLDGKIPTFCQQVTDTNRE